MQETIENFNHLPTQNQLLPRKNMFLSLSLTAILGPLGMFYVSDKGALIMFLPHYLLAFLSAGASFPFTLLICLFWTWRVTRRINKGQIKLA